MTDARPPASVAAVQAAAVERALADDDIARDHLALVGALEPARDAGPDLIGTTAAALLAVRLLDGGRDTASGPEAPGRRDDDPAVRGAAVAHRRFGVAADRAAALADVPVGSVLSALDDGT